MKRLITLFYFVSHLQRKWCEYFMLSNIKEFDSWNLNLTHLSDLSDDLLLKNIAFYYENENVQGICVNSKYVLTIL